MNFFCIFADETVLRGYVESFTLAVSNATYTYSSHVTSVVIGDLAPSTNYTLILTLYVNGGMSISTQPITRQTADGGIVYIMR